MTKKNKSHSEIEVLRGIIRQQKSELRHLKKLVGRSAKRAHQYADLEERESEVLEFDNVVEEHALSKDLCPKCRNTLESSDIGNRRLYICENISCNYRITKKIG